MPDLHSRIFEALIDEGVEPKSLSDAHALVRAHLFEDGDGSSSFTDEKGTPGALVSKQGDRVTDPHEFVRGHFKGRFPHLFASPTPPPSTDMSLTARCLAANETKRISPIAIPAHVTGLTRTLLEQQNERRRHLLPDSGERRQ